MSSIHVSVLPREVLTHLDLRPGLVVVDGTLGAGGHSRKIIEQIAPGGRLLGIDRDPLMLDFARSVVTGPGVEFRQGSYAELPEFLTELGWPLVDRLLVDLGLSSDQLADRQRGFGIQAGGPLDLRFDTSVGQPASDLLQQESQSELARIFTEYGEERDAERIAAAIVFERKRNPIATSEQLAALVSKTVRGFSQTHPATQVFQALRIAVNAELTQLERLLSDVLPRCLAPGGRVVAITFHSLEDRLVKQAFREQATWDNLTPKPVVASPVEVRLNPRSRTAKLRCATRR